MNFPTTHFDKLNAALRNAKLPHEDRPRIQSAIERYGEWRESLESARNQAGRFGFADDGAAFVEVMVDSLSAYKCYVDLDVIFDSPRDFLYRQKGQLKLDNSIIEEFVPHLIYPFLPEEVADSVLLGPRGCFSALSFSGGLARPLAGVGMHVRTKDQDFAISRELFIKASYESNFSRTADQKTFLAYIAAEMKTNLDKTMFQEASATAHDVKTAVAGAKYFLICEWLDMTPLSTAATDVDEVLILRGKRLGSQIRRHYGSSEGRQQYRDDYAEYLSTNPFRTQVFRRFINHVAGVFSDDEPIEEDVLDRGYF